MDENESQDINESTRKRTNSKLWYYITRRNLDYTKTLEQDITIKEIKLAIMSQSNNKATGDDQIPSEIFKNNIHIFSYLIERMFKKYHKEGFPKKWKKGVVTLLYKKGDTSNLDNYRPITLLQTIYKIWATVITNRISPIMNLLTKDNQCAYKAKRSTADAIYYIKQNLIQNRIRGHISFDLSKAFDRIDRNKLWWILYEKGVPIKLIEIIIKGHTDNTLAGKLNGELSNEIENDKGVFQGSPISALLYIIFADGIMDEYKNELKQLKIPKIKILLKNLDIEYKWTEFLSKLKNREEAIEKVNWETPSAEKYVTHIDDSILFSDDTGIGYTDTNEILQKIKIYDKTIVKYGLLVNWKRSLY